MFSIRKWQCYDAIFFFKKVSFSIPSDIYFYVWPLFRCRRSCSVAAVLVVLILVVTVFSTRWCLRHQRRKRRLRLEKNATDEIYGGECLKPTSTTTDLPELGVTRSECCTQPWKHHHQIKSKLNSALNFTLHDSSALSTIWPSWLNIKQSFTIRCPSSQ